MNFRSYPGKVFTVESSKSYVRNEQLQEQRYKAGETLPPGKNVGDIKLIPQRTLIRVIDVKVDSDRHTYVLAVSDEFGEQLGWTSAANLVGRFTNETVGLAPSTWSLEPLGDNMTCVDNNALIRGGGPEFASLGTKIPVRSFVAVTERSPDGVFVKVSNITIAQNEMQIGEEIGWTKAGNLRDGCSDLYFSSAWRNDKGPNGCWRLGEPIGQKLLVNIVGFGAEMEQLTVDTLEPYLALKNAAAEDNIEISINSAFRTYARQAELRRLWDLRKGNRAARPGRSDHQHGQAFDLNTTQPDSFNGTDKVYEWLKRNAPQLGFIRTVDGEPWHWEYIPDEARTLAAQGKFKRAGVSDA
ncbi:MAG TPA: M15 family metallopeptidase [Pyrinomonadaceae bacterium]|nr:M15 family metallopeptidase [Pyrinomonadaceae bacterium]